MQQHVNKTAADTLAAHLERRIRAFGPLTVDAFMAEVLTHPRHGYYVARQPFGRDGDFITAPEVSQMFGELIGAWMAHAWTAMGRPAPVHLIELGPGRGVLMQDALRAMRSTPLGGAPALHVHLVEVSPTLADVQRRALADSGWDVTWHKTFAEVPEGQTLLVANELFDALPIRQFERTRAGWCERLVDASENGEFRFVLTPGPSPAAAMIPAEVRHAAPLGAVAEVSPTGIALASSIAARVRAHGGAALLIDYGTTEFGARDTLQAVAHHETHAVLDAPGTADLCAHVDFATLARAATQAGAQAWGPTTQGEFLLALGIETRAAALSTRATPDQRAGIGAAVGRLTETDAMGIHFKVLCIADPKLSPLPGFP